MGIRVRSAGAAGGGAGPARPAPPLAPAVLCDQCGGAIADAAAARAGWLEARGAPVTGEVHFLHGACADAFERVHPRAPGDAWRAVELRAFLLQLASDLRLGLADELRR
jgi:hypothetical protein